jgi:formate/nitrite transporter FocA (FNT family)
MLYKRMKEDPALLGIWMVLLAYLISGMGMEILWMVVWHGNSVAAFLFFAGFWLGISEQNRRQRITLSPFIK